jgi:hypothetical protein
MGPFNEPLPPGIGRAIYPSNPGPKPAPVIRPSLRGAARIDPREKQLRSMIAVASAVATGSFHGTNPRTGEEGAMRACQLEFAGRWVGGADAGVQVMLDLEAAEALHQSLGEALAAIKAEDPDAPAVTHRTPHPSDLREEVELTIADREDLSRLYQEGRPPGL